MTNNVPNVRLEEYGYAGFVHMRVWQKPAENEKCRLSIDTKDNLKGGHLAAYQYLLHNQDKMKKEILEKLLAMYPDIKEEYGEYFNEKEREELLPEITEPEQLFHLLDLAEIHIHDVMKDGLAYIGFEFGCTWEEEHGLGIMTHKDRIVGIGGADTSILSWIAEEDKEEQMKLEGKGIIS